MWLLASLPGYVGWRMLPAVAHTPGAIATGIAVLLAACAVIPVSVISRSRSGRRVPDTLRWIGLTAMGLLSTLFIATVLRDVFLIGARIAGSATSEARLATPSAWWAIGFTVASTFVGFLMARFPRLVEVSVPIRGLPAGLSGFSIVQVSDLHVGPTIKAGFVRRIVERVNNLDADVIVLTGDLVDGTVPELAEHTQPLGRLTARHGVFAVTGNHEYYSGEGAWTQELRRLGLTVLKNQHVILQRDGASLLLAGVTDFSAHHFDPAQRSDPQAALAGEPSHVGAKVLLAHQPSTAPAAAAAGYDLQLSGHTHGGQFFPWNLLVGYFQPFTRGLNRLRGLQVYVSRGTGYWGPPNRFGVPAEITRLRLVAA